MAEAIVELESGSWATGNMISFAEEESKINFMNSLLDILILAIRKSFMDSDKITDLLFLPFVTLTNIVLKSQNPMPVVKSTVCIKSYLLYMYPQIEARKLSPLIYSILDRLLNPKETEMLSYYIGNILMIMFEKVTEC